MKLLTKAILAKLPPLYANEEKEASETKVVVKFFNPYGQGTWYATEYDGEDMFFGFVNLFEGELGYFSLSELASVKCPPFNLPIERDMHWDSDTTLQDVMDGKAT